MPEFVRFRRPYIIFLSLTLLLFLNACTTSEAPATPQEGQIEVSNLQGLTGAYFNNATFEGNSVTRIDSEVNFDWSDQAPIEEVSTTGYSVRWTGQVQPDTTGSYTFSLNTTGQARLLVNGIIAAQVGWDDPNDQFNQPIDLAAGTKYDLTLEYKQGDANGSVVRLEWQQGGGVSSVVPSSHLSFTSSNLQTAINTLQTDSTFSALGVQLNAENATGSLTPSGYGLIAQHPTETTYYIATLETDPNSPVQSLYSLAIDAQNDAVFSDLNKGRSVAIGSLSSYVDEDGNSTTTQRAALETLLYDFLSGMGTSGGLSTQSLHLQTTPMSNIPSCTSCKTDAEFLERAYGDQAKAAGHTTLGIIAAFVGGTFKEAISWTTGSGTSAVTFWGLIKSGDDVRDKEKAYLDCVAGKISGKLGCPPETKVTPRSISKELAVGEEVIVNTEITNTPASEARLYYWVKQVGDVFADRLGEVEVRGTLDPGQTTQFGHRLYCQKVGTFTGTVSITHNADNEASPITIPVTLECYEPEPDITEPTPNPLRLEADINDFATGSFSFSNDGTADLTYTISHGQADYALLKVVSPKKGTVTPGSTAKVTFDAYCNGVVGTFSFVISINSNDPDTPKESVIIRLTCVMKSNIMLANAKLAGHATGFNRMSVYEYDERGYWTGRILGYYWMSAGDIVIYGSGGTAYLQGFRGNRWTSAEFIRHLYYCRTDTSYDYVFRKPEVERQLNECRKAEIQVAFEEAISVIQQRIEAYPKSLPLYSGERVTNYRIGKHRVFPREGILADIVN